MKMITGDTMEKDGGNSCHGVLEDNILTFAWGKA
jgi:hypothetical protein